MEARQITVIYNAVKVVVNNSTAKTLGEFKVELLKAAEDQNIDFNIPENAKFKVGCAGYDLIDDFTLLPKSIEIRGIETTDLALLMTRADKNIPSGDGVSRKTLFDTIKQYNLQERVKEVTGKNYTVVSNVILNDIITEYIDNVYSEKAISSFSNPEPSKPMTKEDETQLDRIETKVDKILEILTDGVITDYEDDYTVEESECDEKPVKVKSNFSDADLMEMFQNN